MSSEPPQPPSERRRLLPENGRQLTIAVLAVLVTLFAVFNLDEVKVHWVVGSGQAPLIIVIVISMLVGIVLTHFAERRNKQRR